MSQHLRQSCSRETKQVEKENMEPKQEVEEASGEREDVAHHSTTDTTAPLTHSHRHHGMHTGCCCCS